MSDYIRITVTEGISPIKVTVQLGELICFNTLVNSGIPDVLNYYFFENKSAPVLSKVVVVVVVVV